MFRGQYEHTMDGKGRISIPARYREVLAQMDTSGNGADRIILTRTFQQCLEIYPLDKWLAFEDKIRGLSQFNPHVQYLKRVYVASAIECSIDSHGRLGVPLPLREFAMLERECIWVGQLDTVQLWSKNRWQAAVDEALQDPEELAKAMSDFGL